MGALLTSISIFYVGRLEQERDVANTRVQNIQAEWEKELRATLHEREETLREREALIQERESITQTKEDFVSVALHEINTPLTLLTGYAAMLMEADTLEQARQHAEGIVRSAGRFRNMKRFSDTLLRRLSLEPVELCQVVNNILDDPDLYVATRKQPGDVTITADCAPAIIEADLFKLQTAVMELVRNALKACDGGGSVQVRCYEANSGYAISVTDNGIGIHPDDYQRIWHPGVQIFDNMMTRRNEGAGYGLYMVRRVAEAHGGRAVLDRSELGRGSRFSIYLPKQS
jgi:signal transduction histidine kinase